MGIKGLTDVIVKHAPHAISKHTMKSFAAKTIAIDASLSIYQFLIAIRGVDGNQLCGPSGEVTSHLQGTFHRTINMIHAGILPVYVFDGAAPSMKRHELDQRESRRIKAKAAEDSIREAQAQESATLSELVTNPTSDDSSPTTPQPQSPSQPELDQQAEPEPDQQPEPEPPREMNLRSKSQVQGTSDIMAEAEHLLRLMGVPIVLATGEAEAQCAELVLGGRVHAVGSEDLDTLAFGSPRLIRNLTAAESKKRPILEICLDKALGPKGLDMDMEQFVELCILLGCDYLPGITGVGPIKALKLMKEHNTLSATVAFLRERQAAKLTDPKIRLGGIVIADDWDWESAKQLFMKPDVRPSSEMTITRSEPNVEGLVQFLVNEKGFAEDRVRKHAEKLRLAFVRDSMKGLC